MNDLSNQIWNMAISMNRAKAAEILNENSIQRPIGRWDKPAISAHIAKIPLRAEVRDMLKAAELYDQQASRAREKADDCSVNAKAYYTEADRLEQLGRDARAQAENLERMANL